MAYENIEIQHGNFVVDRSGSFFYTINHTAGTLIKKNISGAVVQTYTLNTTTKEVTSLQFDGYYFWSVDNPVLSGFRVRKWEIGTDDLVRVVSDYLYTSDVINTYDVTSIAVESYTDSLDNVEVVGTTAFDVVDGQVVSPGDILIIGPSTATGFVGLYSFTSVISKVGNTITVNTPLTCTFNPGDPVHFSRNFFAFSDIAPGNLNGALYRFNSNTGALLTLDSSNMYGGVRAATFFKNKIMFIRGSEVVWLNPDSQTIFKSQAINNTTADRTNYIDTFDISGYSETLYRLEQQNVTFNEGLSRWQTETWSPSFNLNTSSFTSEVYFVTLKAEPQIIHKYTSEIEANDPTDLESVVEVTVLDQFRTPISNRVVDFTSTGGPLSSIQETTDTNGQVRVKYTANSVPTDVTITAEVT